MIAKGTQTYVFIPINFQSVKMLRLMFPDEAASVSLELISSEFEAQSR